MFLYELEHREIFKSALLYLSREKHEMECLKKKLHEKDAEMQEQKLSADSEIAGFKEQLTLTKFYLDKHTSNFILDLRRMKCLIYFILFLQPEANALIYWGSVTNIDFTTERSNHIIFR